jgi:hypothetical protein
MPHGHSRVGGGAGAFILKCLVFLITPEFDSEIAKGLKPDAPVPTWRKLL